MKPKKMSLKEIQGVLSRDEMKRIMAGSGGPCSGACAGAADQGHCSSFVGCVCSAGTCVTA